MNMMTTQRRSPAPSGAAPMPFLRLLPHVDTALAVSGVRPTEFGSRVARDPGLLRDMRDRGRKPRVKLRLEIERYADQLLADARARALATLLAAGGVGDVVESLIAVLDQRDGDTDVEANGDELDGSMAEDDFHLHSANSRGEPGCPLSDPDVGADDDDYNAAADPAWLEWQTRGRHKLDAFGAERMAREADGYQLHEDAEAAGDEADTAWVEQPASWPAVVMVVGDRTATEDDEAEEDRCLAGDDMVRAGPVEHRGLWFDRGRASGWEIGDEADGERSCQPAQTHVAANEVAL